MKNKNIIFDDEAVKELKAGIDILNDAVKSTLGPAGRNVIIEGENGELKSTKDGVTVAKTIKLKDPVKNIGAQLVKQAANQTAEQAGDGTTTSTVLATKMIKEGLKLISMGVNPIELKQGILQAVVDVKDKLLLSKKDIKDSSEIEQIGTISSNNDAEVGRLIAEAMKEVGIDGVITVEESKSNENSLELVEGMQLPKGYLSPYFINNNSNMQFENEDVYILLYDQKINDLSKGLINLLELVIHQNKPLLIIADDVSGAALAGLVVNKTRGIVSVCAVKSPEFGDRKKSIMEDLAVVTGGTLISPDKGMSLEKLTDLSSLGKARLVTVNNKQTTIIDGAGDVEKIKERIEEIKILIEKADSDFEREKLQERLAKLSGGISILHVGAETEIELKEKTDRVDDALHATKAAVEEGIMPGGGITLMNIFKNYNYDHSDSKTADWKLGYDVVINSLSEPFNAIMENAGLNGEAVWAKVDGYLATKKDKSDSKLFGFDARKQKIVNMYDAGIIDPVKVTRIALEKAASVAITFFITNCVITLDPDDKDDVGINNMGLM